MKKMIKTSLYLGLTLSALCVLPAIAMDGSDKVIAESNTSNQSSIQLQLDQELLDAAKNGDVTTIKTLVDQGANVNSLGSDYCTPLHISAYLGHTETVQILLDLGADITMRNTRGCIALHCAAQNGHIQTIETLVAKKIGINACDFRGSTPLHHAAKFGHYKAATILIDNGADINSQDLLGHTPLSEAAEGNHAQVTITLIDEGADYKIATDYENFTAQILSQSKNYLAKFDQRINNFLNDPTGSKLLNTTEDTSDYLEQPANQELLNHIYKGIYYGLTQDGIVLINTQYMDYLRNINNQYIAIDKQLQFDTALSRLCNKDNNKLRCKFYRQEIQQPSKQLILIARKQQLTDLKFKFK